MHCARPSVRANGKVGTTLFKCMQCSQNALLAGFLEDVAQDSYTSTALIAAIVRALLLHLPSFALPRAAIMYFWW